MIDLRNSEERRPVELRGFAFGGEREADVLLTDLSYGGCRLISSETFEAGEKLKLLVLRRGAIEAEIRWASDGLAGAAFVG